MSVAEQADEAVVAKNPIHARAVIIGTGFSGLGMGIALQKQGFGHGDGDGDFDGDFDGGFVILEKADDIGGTWRDNRYPGIAVDIPSFSYQFSFELNPDWSRVFAPGREIKAYADHCVDKYALRDRI